MNYKHPCKSDGRPVKKSECDQDARGRAEALVDHFEQQIKLIESLAKSNRRH